MSKQQPYLANQLCFAIYNSNRLLNQFYKKSLSPFGLTYTQYLVLLALWEKDGQSLRELGEKLDLASNTLTPLLKRLEDKNYLLRLRPEKDQRQLIVQLTENGKELQIQVEKVLDSCLTEVTFFPADKLREMIKDHQDLAAMLKERN
ncbi:MarR family transcriptional regulator [Streptococcus chenjunshii]|uniref:HTH-type transcriptional regulator SarZ n=1 Tax=Streptococcus chenjunshii TaxID=2173853 RepID=A0A372KM23_9STRE|nr:MarR family transcriptional regulator [Streptococcus chenjunshii]AXQ79105.1 MarR family transcriptional regulator [Streptococcus chenjunshii]RFU50300.1 MarR family transcriptional regulator [Streptococcus chenjunshii]RFU53331.1 MarR family transcriptional regulator [Streptococcus chenjunshii]